MAETYTGLDTNVLVRYLARDDAHQYRIAAEVIESLTSRDAGFITQLTLAEVYWVLSRSMKLTRRECLGVMQRIAETESFDFDDAEGVGRALALAEEGADFGDALIQSTMEMFGISRTVTFDRKAAKHLGWELLDSSS